jgi:hypothetical protein
LPPTDVVYYGIFELMTELNPEKMGSCEEGRMSGLCEREKERKNKKYEPITNPASKASDVEQGVEMSTMVTDNIGNTIFYFYSMNNKHTCDK